MRRAEAIAAAGLERFNALRREGMALCPLPSREGDPVNYLRRVWLARQCYGRDYAIRKIREASSDR